MPHAYANRPAATDEALGLLNEFCGSIRNTPPHAYAAWSHEQRFFRGGFHPEDKTSALEHARIALDLGTDDPQALSVGGFVYANVTHDYETSLGALYPALLAMPDTYLNDLRAQMTEAGVTGGSPACNCANSYNEFAGNAARN